LFALLIWNVTLSAGAQVNSWLKSGSGNWEEPQWSLGVLPGTNQTIMITNAGWKAVAIASSTENYPSALSVYSITLSSPLDGYNTLLFNYPGQQTPLATRLFTVSSNSAVSMYNAALNLTGGGGEGMSVGGQFIQDAGSTVLGQQMDIGYIGPGVFNLMSGNVWLQHIWLGGNYNGRMVQSGGANGSGIVHLQSGGEYDLQAGDYNADTYFDGGALRQTGGRINVGLGVYSGTYILENGIITGGVGLPAPDGFSGNGGGTMIQSGGTNFGGVAFNPWAGYGSYVLSNGVCLGSNIATGAKGNVQQWNGTLSVTGKISTATDYVARETFGAGSYNLAGGAVSAAAMDAGGHYTQTGGTNIIGGDVSVYGVYADMQVNGGEFRCSTISVVDAWVGGFTQSAGRLVISNQLWVGAETLYGWRGYVMTGGELDVSDIVLIPGSKFTKSGGVINQGGLLSISAADLYFGGSTSHFGPMNLQAGSPSQTNTTIHFPIGTNCFVSFGDSSWLNWTNTARLLIVNYSGSFAGGGSQRIYFGTSASGLTAIQLAQITFRDPAGFEPGNYTAKILQTGEVVPDALPPTGHVAPILNLAHQNDGSVQLIIRGESMANYEIDISSNLTSWISWTNVSTPAGNAIVTDTTAAAVPRRFYRALLLP
jgi:hypothetical protein